MDLRKSPIVRLMLYSLCVLTMGVADLPAQVERTQATIDQLLTRIDMDLLEKCEQGIHARLRGKIQQFGDWGLYPDPEDSDQMNFFRVNGDQAKVNFLHRGLFNSTAEFFRAYEILGEKQYLDAALKTCEFFIKAQTLDGHWLLSYSLTRDGTVAPDPEPMMKWRITEDPKVVRLQDGYQYCPFSLMLWAYKLTGDRRYLESAKRCTDLIITLQHPENGSCPDNYDMRLEDRTLLISGGEGVETGGSYNDGATTDPLCMTFMMYHLTKDKKYLERSAKIGQWMFDTQIGKGEVRGWCQQYGPHNEPTSARHFEMPSIEPRVFNRFTGPMLTWFYLMTGNERYRTLLEETFRWMKSVEVPGPNGGWYYQYLTYGEPVFSHHWQMYRIDRPDTWPVLPTPSDPWITNPSRAKANLASMETIMTALQKGGLEGLRKFWYTRPVKFTPEQYRDARIVAAKRALLEDFEITAGRGAADELKDMIRRETQKRTVLLEQLNSVANQGHNTIAEEITEAQWQYVYDVRLALGRIDADIAAKGGRSFESHFSEPWDITSDWTSRAVEVENWMDIPINEFDK